VLAEAGSLLSNVWCTSANACTAVGDSPTGANGTVRLAERWNGSPSRQLPEPGRCTLVRRGPRVLVQDR
jgi:hypothetical protein